MLVAVVEISRPLFIGGFNFLSAHLCDEPVPIEREKPGRAPVPYARGAPTAFQ